jgi:hypothetical protein
MPDEAKSKPGAFKIYLIAGSVVFTAAAAAAGGMMIASILKVLSPDSTGFPLDSITAPLRFMAQFYPLTILVVLAVVLLVGFGLAKAKVWYLVPVGICLIGVYWFLSGLMVYNTLKAYEQEQEGVALTVPDSRETVGPIAAPTS